MPAPFPFSPSDGPVPLTYDIATLTSEPFKTLVDQEVTMEAVDGRAVTARLTKVEELPRSTPPDAPRTSFHLILKVPEPCPFATGYFTLSHPDLGHLGPLHKERIFPGSMNSPLACFEVTFS